MRRQSVEQMVAKMRRSLQRLGPAEAWSAAQAGAVIVDVRSEDEQRRQGWLVPGAQHHPLSTVLWRLDPDVPTANEKPPLDSWLIVVCRQGYSSSMAAFWLQRIGFTRATDVIGGVAAWHEAGLPLEPYA